MIEAPPLAAIPHIRHGFGEKQDDAPKQSLVFMQQVHGSECVQIDVPPASRPQVDGLITSRDQLALAVVSADCAPVLLADQTRPLVAAFHAGWRGTLAGITENAVDALCRAGAEKKQIVAAIGPTISRQSYEVGEEFYQQHLETDPATKSFFTPAPAAKKYHFDLPNNLALRLRRAGVDSVWQSPDCTFTHKDRFFSYRRGDSGKRQFSFIMIC